MTLKSTYLMILSSFLLRPSHLILSRLHCGRHLEVLAIRRRESVPVPAEGCCTKAEEQQL